MVTSSLQHPSPAGLEADILYPWPLPSGTHKSCSTPSIGSLLHSDLPWGAVVPLSSRGFWGCCSVVPMNPSIWYPLLSLIKMMMSYSPILLDKGEALLSLRQILLLSSPFVAVCKRQGWDQYILGKLCWCFREFRVEMGFEDALFFIYIIQFCTVNLICAVLCLVTQLCPTLCNPTDCSPPGSSVCGNSPGWEFQDKNSRQEYWDGLPCPPPGSLPTQWSNPALLCCRWILYHPSHEGSPWILEWVAYSFARGTSWPRNWTRVSYIAGRATWEAPDYMTRKQTIICISLHLLCKTSFCGHYEWSTIKISVRVIRSQYSWAVQWMI